MNGEAATTGARRILAWKVDRGQVNGVTLDGLAVVAALASDTNLAFTKSAANRRRRARHLRRLARECPQRKALVAMVRSLSGNLIGSVVQETAARSGSPTTATRSPSRPTREAGGGKHLNHDASCGNKQWFNPLTRVDRAEMGTTDQNEFSGRRSARSGAIRTSARPSSGRSRIRAAPSSRPYLLATLASADC
jgi:hypothetical protein